MEREASIRIYTIDNQPVFRLGLASLIHRESDYELVGQACDAKSALREIPKLTPHVVTLDLTLPDMNGLELIREIRRRKLSPAILVLSTHDEDVFAQRALKLGADGYLMKTASGKEILAAIKQVAQQEVALSKRQSGLILKRVLGRGPQVGSSPHQLLSDRELEVFGLIGQGKNTRAVAEALFISVKAVETHQAHIKRKLELTNHTQLIRAAFAWVNELEAECPTNENTLVTQRLTEQ